VQGILRRYGLACELRWLVPSDAHEYPQSPYSVIPGRPLATLLVAPARVLLQDVRRVLTAAHSPLAFP
jgi:hypothetical protein